MKIILTLLSFILILTTSFWWYTRNDINKKIYTQKKENVINDEWLDDPINAWTKSVVEWTDWIEYEDMSTNDVKQENMINYISKWVNYFLWFLWLLVIILIIKDGIVIITAWWDDNKEKEAFKNVKNYIIAIILIWVSYLIINLIFRFVHENTKGI